MIFGNQICCGSYACLNALQDNTVDLLLLELSTGVPFGIRHEETPTFDRLLTTFRDPNESLDAALRLWGCHVTTFHLETRQELNTLLCSHLADWNRVVLGPVDMGTLEYYPASRLLSRMDHYLTLEFCDADTVLCTDSEGFQGLRIGIRHLTDWISVENLPEACGTVTLRILERKHPFCRSAILRAATRQAADNLTRAAAAGEGPAAVRKCLDFLARQDIALWRLPFLYDLEHLQERKRLQEWLLQQLRTDGMLSVPESAPLEDILSRQIASLGQAYAALLWETVFLPEPLLSFASLEQSLTDCMGRLFLQTDSPLSASTAPCTCEDAAQIP